METYYGHIRTPQDALVVFEACRARVLGRVQRRLSEKERSAIRAGSVFVWDEREAGMRRWTDGKSWSASRVSGSFLTYREMEGRRCKGSPDDSGDDGCGGGGGGALGYKHDGFTKQSFSITTADLRRLHLIAYCRRAQPAPLQTPSQDPRLRDIVPPAALYPDADARLAPRRLPRGAGALSALSAAAPSALSALSVTPSAPSALSALSAPSALSAAAAATAAYRLPAAYDPPAQSHSWQEESRALHRLNQGLARVFC